MWFAKKSVEVGEQRSGQSAAPVAAPNAPLQAPTSPPAKPKRTAAKIDKRLTALSRELRDQWQDRVAADVGAATGKYDVRRVGANAVVPGIEGQRESPEVRQLAA
jgi:hypothetical protein